MENLLALLCWGLSLFFAPIGADEGRTSSLENTYSLVNTFNGIGVLQINLKALDTGGIERHLDGRVFRKVPDLVVVDEARALGASQPHTSQTDNALPDVLELESVSLARSPSDLGGNTAAVKVPSLPDGFGSKVGSVSSKYDTQGGQHTNKQRYADTDRRKQQLGPAESVRDKPLMSRLPLGAQIALLSILGSLAYWPGLAGLVLIGFGWEERRLGLGTGLLWVSGLSFTALMWTMFGWPR